MARERIHNKRQLFERWSPQDPIHPLGKGDSGNHQSLKPVEPQGRPGAPRWKVKRRQARAGQLEGLTIRATASQRKEFRGKGAATKPQTPYQCWRHHCRGSSRIEKQTHWTKIRAEGEDRGIPSLGPLQRNLAATC